MNAKQELLEVLKGASIKCANIYFPEKYDYKGEEDIVLKVNHSPADLEEFLNQLDREYDNGYGGQELYGTIWIDDIQWLSRGEYDGSEWWDWNVIPDIPNNLK